MAVINEMKTVEIPVAEYAELLKLKVRVELLVEYTKKESLIGRNEICMVLGINNKENTEV